MTGWAGTVARAHGTRPHGRDAYAHAQQQADLARQIGTARRRRIDETARALAIGLRIAALLGAVALLVRHGINPFGWVLG